MPAHPNTVARPEVLLPAIPCVVPTAVADRSIATKKTLPISILGVPFDHVTLDTAVERIHTMVQSRDPHYVVTANVDFLVQARRDVELRYILINAHLVLCDGTPLVWASRWFGNALPQRVAGADLVPRLIEAAAIHGWNIFFLGGAPEVTARAVDRLKLRHPELKVCGHYSPPFRSLIEMDHEEIAARIRAARPDLLFVSFGCPKAEKWISMHYQSLGVPVAIGVGATIDFLAGQVKRAPIWAQRAGLEWTFRLAQEPRRLGGRYAADIWNFGRGIMGQAWCMKLRPGGLFSPRHAWPQLLDGEWESIDMPERLDAETVHTNTAIWERVGNRHLVVELGDVRFIDSTGLGLLLWLRKRLDKTRRRLVLVAPSRAVRRTLYFTGVQGYFRTADSAEEAQQRIERELGESPAFCRNDNPRLLFWRGEITAQNVEEVWKVTNLFVANTGSQSRKLWIDLANIHFMDSSGVVLMRRVKSFAQARETILCFTGAPMIVRQVLRSAGQGHLLEDNA